MMIEKGSAVHRALVVVVFSLLGVCLLVGTLQCLGGSFGP
jgi:hypothetical protein